MSNRSEPAAVWLKRNGLLTRWLHGTNALTVLILLFTGLALGDRFGDGLVELSGGHELINDVHQWLGTGYTVAAAVLALVFARKTAGLLRDMAVFRRTDWAWMPAFARHYFRPGHHAPPFHEGRFDPAQRLVFIGLTVSLVLVAASGIVLFAFVDMSRAVFMWTIRTHIAAAWLLIISTILHVLAGLGLPRTHRGLVRAMFGDGRVRLGLAQTLWPGWVRGQQHQNDRADELSGDDGRQ